MSEDTLTTNQIVINSLRELTASVQDLCKTISSENRPDKSRAERKANDAVSNTLHEQINNGRPERISDWEKVELLPVEEIEKENEQYTEKYEGFWRDIDESTPSEKVAATQGYTSAFSRFAEINHILGWRGNVNDEDALFDNPVLTKSRDLLIESIFGTEVYQISRFGESSERSRMLFELSRLPRLLVVLVRIACRQVYIVSACGADKAVKERPFNARAVVKVLALVARTLKGGHLASSLSLEKLLCSCYERRILVQPNVSDIDTYTKQFDLIYDCTTALDFTKRFREIRDPLCALLYMRYKSDSIQTIFQHIETHREATVGIDRFPELPLKESTESTFHPEIFSAQYLQEFGRLNIEWTDCLDEHLKIHANRNAIRVFAHPTFFYNGIDLHRDERDYTHPTYFELAQTYALLFRPTSSSNIQRLKRYTTAGEEQQIRWHKLVTFDGRAIHRFEPRRWDKQVDASRRPMKKLDINPLRYPTRDILSESFWRCSLPPSIQVAYDIANPSGGAVKGLSSSWDQHRLTSTPMQQFTKLAPNYPEDLKFMITSIMENDFLATESFVRFPYFAPRLRKIKTYLDSRQPSSMRELWVDRRDFRAWWMFWGGGLLGVAVLVLMFWILLLQVVSLAGVVLILDQSSFVRRNFRS